MRVLTALLYGDDKVPITFNSISITKNEEVKGNKMTINIDNPNYIMEDGQLKFKIEEGLLLYAKCDYDGTPLDTGTASNDLIFTGTIQSIKLRTSDKFRCTIECTDTTFELLNRLWGKNYVNMTAPEMIQNLIDMSSRTSKGTYMVTTELDNNFPYTSGIQNKRSDTGTPSTDNFPLYNFGKSHKPIFEWIDELSQTSYTNTTDEINNSTEMFKRPFRYFIDPQNKFHWFYPTDTPDYYFKYGSTEPISPDTKQHRIIHEDLEFSQFDQTNFIIFKSGEDMNNVQVLWYDLDPASGALTTADSFRNWEDIAREMKKEDLSNISFVESDKFDYPTTYPVTPLWDSQQREVYNDSEYNDNFREEAIRRGVNRCKRVFQRTGNPRWKGKITIHGENIQPTTLINYSSRFGLVKIKLRVTSLNHTIDKDTFLTVINCEEDDKEVN